MPKYYSPDGNLEVWEEKPQGYYTEEEWQEMHPAPTPPEPTTEEKIAELDAQYNTDFTQLMLALDKARIYENAELMEEIKADIIALDEQYDADYEAIVGGAE